MQPGPSPQRQAFCVDGDHEDIAKAAFLLLSTGRDGRLAQRGARVASPAKSSTTRSACSGRASEGDHDGPAALQTKSNKKGEWTIKRRRRRMEPQFSKDGFDPQNGKVTVDRNRIGDITVKLAKHTEEGRPAPATEGREGMLLSAQSYEARKIFQDLLVKFPDVRS
jgi:hypothetical protein